jgi:Spy/CpxP family protein refolding chaperone
LGADAVIGAAAKAKLLVFAVFLVGAVTGAAVEKVYETRSHAEATPQKNAERVTREIQDYLDLTDEQRQQWTTIFQESRRVSGPLFEENRRLTAANNLKMEELRDQTRSKIKMILTDEQKQKYEEHLKRMRRQGQQPRPSRPEQQK